MKRYPQHYEAGDFVFFLHIPKSAGTSVTKMLLPLFDEDSVLGAGSGE